eukprot:TRINITY_DN18865_c0_g1_i1.p1 TRINITY_DN18865_c0_g1~~TRINITY_DN18865_c0_g1_i1.p1  ORF type:complete len:680 (+),score=67.32 TRINITY_DN18865_c0_g1_i1:224-2263(+)
MASSIGFELPPPSESNQNARGDLLIGEGCNGHRQDDSALTTAQRLVAPVAGLQMRRYPGELCFAIVWAFTALSLTVWILVSMIVCLLRQSAWSYNALLSVIGILALLLAAYSFQIGWGALRWTCKFRSVMDKDWHAEWERLHAEQQGVGVLDWDEVHHFVIVTVYKEDLKYLKSVAYTLMSQNRPRMCQRSCEPDPLLSSTHATPGGSYCMRSDERSFCQEHITLVLAFELSAGEAEARAKARRLRDDLGHHFRDIVDVYHPDPLLHPERNEIRGKASNFRWAAQEVDSYVERTGLRADHCIVHVADYDSLYDPNHFPCVSYDFCSRQDREYLVWQPCMMPTGNIWRLFPGVRQMTVTITAQEMMSASDPCEFQIPFSTYGMALKTLRFIGGGKAGDAQDGDVIAEDHHLFVKGFFATGGLLRVQPIFLPCFNFTEEGCECLSRGCSCFSGNFGWDSRFTQASRHMFGIAELAYYFSLLFRGKWCEPRYRFGFRGTVRLLRLGSKLIKIHAVAYLGLWVFLGCILSFVVKSVVSYCQDPLHRRHEICQTDLSPATASIGDAIFVTGTTLALLGSILANVAFAKMLHATDYRLEHIANPNGAFMGPEVFPDEPRPRERLVPLGQGAPWVGVVLQLSLEQVIFGIVGSMYYGTVAAIVALKNLIIIGHRLRYVSSIGLQNS